MGGDKHAQSVNGSAQGKVLRRKMAGKLAVWTLLYLLAFAALVALAELEGLDDLSDRIADSTSEWIYIPAERAQEFWDSTKYAIGTFSWNTGAGVVELRSANLQTLPQDNGGLAVRDLSVYYTLRAMKWPLAGVAFLLGYIAVTLALLNRSLRYFDEITGAVEGIVLDRTTPMRLSTDLAITQGELNTIRETALANERAAIQEERRKNELVTYLAHDIRTPLTSVMGYLSLLDEAPDLPSNQRKRYIRRALDGAAGMEGLVGELFEITRFNLARMPIERQKLDMRLFCEQIADELMPLALERGLSINVDVKAPADVRLFADPEKLGRALGNVVRNAISHADSGTAIELLATEGVCAAEGTNTAAWKITVANQGREIAPEHLERIFDQFYRVDVARTSGGGAGLGLAIAREIVQAHGGSISAMSEGGTTAITIMLPSS